MNMDTEDYIDMLSVRAADMRAMALFFAIIHTGLLVVLGFAGSGLEDSGIQLALTAVIVLTSLWTVFFMDDCMQDLFAISRDLPEDFQASNVGNIRYRRSEDKKVDYVHTLNGSGLATPRLMVALLESYQTSDGKIALPKVLHKPMGMEVLD